MSWTQAELDALKRAYARGVTRVTYEGKTVEYASTDDLAKRIARIEREVSSSQGRARPRGAFASFSRGNH